MKQIVWMSVASTVFIAVSIIYGWYGRTDLVLATGSAAIATAILATREK